MTRIADLAMHTSLVGNILDTQKRVYEAEVQVSTEQRSPRYSGISIEVQRLTYVENTHDRNERYVRNNEVMDMRLSIEQDNFDAIETVFKDFKKNLETFIQNGMTDTNDINQIQQDAFNSLKLVEAYLNESVDGQFLFGGSRTNRSPVDFGLDTLSAFQSKYDGSVIEYPVRRDNHVAQRITATTGHPHGATPDSPAGAGVETGYGTLDFTDAGDTIRANTALAFKNIPVGSTISISGTTGGTYDGDYTVTSNSSTILVVDPPLAGGDLAGEAGVTIAVNNSYYQGDSQARTHRIDDDRTIDLNTTAIDPAFEKGIRALAIMAQGDFANNTSRATEAKWLLSSSLDEPTSGTSPYETEQSSNLTQLGYKLGYKRVWLEDANKTFKTFNAYLEGVIRNIEGIDAAEAIVKLTDETRALEASYAALAKVRSLTLADYI